MKKILSVIFIFIGLLNLFISSCTKSNAGGSPTPDACAGITITVSATITSASTGQANGSINATATGGSGFTFSLNGGTPQSSGAFSNLAAGNYSVAAKSSTGCSGSAAFVVSSVNVCSGVTITATVTTTAATPCLTTANGSITITASGSTGFTYSINNGTFQNSNVFNSLAAGSYSFVAKDVNGCSQSGSATVAIAAAGAKYSAVKQVMLNSCAISGCHIAPNPQNGLDFSIDCTIIATKDRIKARAVDGIPSFMPPLPSAQLSATDKQKIVDWVNAGGGYAN